MSKEKYDSLADEVVNSGYDEVDGNTDITKKEEASTPIKVVVTKEEVSPIEDLEYEDSSINEQEEKKEEVEVVEEENKEVKEKPKKKNHSTLIAILIAIFVFIFMMVIFYLLGIFN